jgi:23S rRNA A2030 N6-methylase RlmJ
MSAPAQRASQPGSNRLKVYIDGLLAREISTVTRYHDRVIQWMPRDEDRGLLLSRIHCADKVSLEKDQAFPDLTGEQEQRTAVLLNGTLNHHFDIQGLLLGLRAKLSRTLRIVLILYNPYLAGSTTWLTIWEYAKAMLQALTLPASTWETLPGSANSRSSGSEFLRIFPGGCWAREL